MIFTPSIGDFSRILEGDPALEVLHFFSRKGSTMIATPRRLVSGLLCLVVAAGWTAASLAAATSESWDAIYIGAEKVGHVHVKVAPVKDKNGRDLVRVQVNTVLSFKRGKDRANMEVRYGTIETPQGAVLRLDTRTLAAQGEIRTWGDVIDGNMNLMLEAGGQRQEKLIPWGDDVRGPYAAELTLSRQPMSEGEVRDVKTFIPDMNQICTTRLECKAMESIPIGVKGETRELRRVEMSVLDPGGKRLPELDSTLWVDSGGQILKSYTSLLGGMTNYRTTKEAALSANGNFDLLTATILKIGKTIPKSETTRDIVYRVTLKSNDAAGLFPNDARQTFKPGASPGTATLEVRTQPQTAPAGGAVAKPEEVQANPLVDSNDPRVVQLAKKAVGTKTDPWQKATAIQDWVFKNMTSKNFNTAFAPASEVARNLEGDCTEHGVLTAAMCRAVGIPARTVVGLLYVDKFKGFGPHMWNEVLIDGRWVAIDSAFNQSDVDATHIKLAESSLDGVAPFETFLPILRVIDSVTIEPVEIR